MSNLTSTVRQLILPIIFAALAGIVVAFLAVGWNPADFVKILNQGKAKITGVLPAKKDQPLDFVAVYMENGKVYFGKIKDADSDEPKLTDVFLLNVKISEEPKRGSSEPEGKEATVEKPQLQTDFELVRLTDQFQAPTDQLVLTRDKILFWEPLRADSKVVEAIKKYKQQ